MNTVARTLDRNAAAVNASGFGMRLRLHLELGRVSNLPTVWSNVFCGAVVAAAISGAAHTPSLLFIVFIMVAMSTFYIAGMYLNDACDAEIDGIERPDRPIPSGRISKCRVLLFTLFWFSIGWVILLTLVHTSVNNSAVAIYALIAAAMLNGCIVLYDFYHKNNPASPIIMGLCRVLVIVTSYALIVATVAWTDESVYLNSTHYALLGVCALVLMYLSGLTFIAKFENQSTLRAAWPIAVLLLPVGFGCYASFESTLTIIPTLLLAIAVIAAVLYVRGPLKGGIPKAIGMLIAGISLIDAIIMSAYGSQLGMGFGVAAFILTLLFQRKIAGT